MGNLGQIEIHIVGLKGNNPLTPDNYDIKEIIYLLSNIEPLLYPGMKGNRPDIAYRIEPGSVRNIFTVTKQAETAFAAIASMVASTQSIDALELPSARAIEQIQAMGKQNVETGEIDSPSLKLLKIIDYEPSFDEGYLNELINKVGDRFNGMDVDEYISKIRGMYA